jgi:hypothetical protein
VKLVSAWIAAAVVAFLAIVAPAAAVAPATLDPVAPGVPGGGRAWELVTPGEVVAARPVSGFNINPIAGVSVSGDRVIYRSAATLPDATFGGVTVSNLAVRGADGWVSASLEAPTHYQDSSGITGGDGPAAFDADLTSSIWTNGLPSPDGLGIYFRGPDGSYTHLVTVGEGGRFAGASSDLSRIVFSSPRHFLSADATRTKGNSIYVLEDGQPQLVDVEDDGSLISSCGASLSRISTDARRVLFTASPHCGPDQHVYLRADGHTIDVSASQCTAACGPESSAAAWGMTANGSVVFLATSQRLTDEDSNEIEDIYSYDVSSGALRLLTPRVPGFDAPLITEVHSAGGPAFFQMNGPLRPGDGTGLSLYLFDEDGLRYVAGESDYAPCEDGRHLFLLTRSQLAATDTDESLDVYRFDSVTGEAIQLSIGPEGRGNGDSSSLFPYIYGQGRTVPVSTDTTVFETQEQLLPGDRNSQVDLYAWTEASGLSLVSGGTPGFSASLDAATPDFSDIFFSTNATLLPRDRDGGEIDVYDASVGGGLPEPGPEAGCISCSEPPAKPILRRQLAAGGGDGRSLAFAPIGGATLRQLARRGWATLLVEVPTAGRVTARGWGRARSQRRVLASGSAAAKQAGPVHLRLDLTPDARRQLARGRELRLELTLRLAGVDTKRSTRLVLKRAS